MNESSDTPKGDSVNLGNTPMRAPWLKDGKREQVEVPTIHRSGGRTEEGTGHQAAGAAAHATNATTGQDAAEGATGSSRATQVAQPMAFEFSGSTGEYFRIWAVNICLTILTLGFYSAWAKVRNNRYFYGSTRVAGSTFDYHANPMAILKGRSIVVLYLLAWTVIGGLIPMMELIFWLVTAALIPWAVVRGRMFHLGNTSWRNIRMGFDGEYKPALKIFVGIPILMPFTLGLLYPYFQARRYSFLIGESRLGESGFSMDAPWKSFYKPYIVAGLSVVGVFAVLGFLTMMVAPVTPAEMSQVGAGSLLFGIVGTVLMIGVYAFAYAYVQAHIGNLAWNSTTLGPHAFRSTLAARDLAMLYVTNTFAIACTMGLAIPWAKVRTARYRMDHLTLIPAGDLDAFITGSSALPGALGDELGEGLDLDLGL
ncbi:MAG: YjgN family protein [Leptospirillia bacterium]